MDLFKYRVIIAGRIQSNNRHEVEARIRAGFSLTLPIHESVDELTITVETDIDELKRRFT